jgi:hypothetical protein
MPFSSVADEMHKFKHGQLHSGRGGPKVTNRKQAIAIALSEERRAGGEPESMKALKKQTKR